MVTLRKDQPGAVGLPPGIKDITRTDFRNDMWIRAIEAKGYRIAWGRTAQCPCKSVSTQTDQADPNCDLCHGGGWLFFRPANAVVNPRIIGPLTPIQQRVVANNAACIHGIMTALSNTKRAWEHAGPRLEGMSMVTVRAENKLGFYDRITCLDARIVYSQLFKVLDRAAPLVTRYPIVQINLLRSIDTTYVEKADFDLVVGDIVWRTGKAPAVDTPLVAHYLCHPTWRVMEHPHATRVTLTKFKQKEPLTPQGEPQDLPVQAMLKYEFLVE
jgi:hypothetical protein